VAQPSPAADVAQPPSVGERGRRLAALPVRLVSGRVAAAPADGLTPTHLSLIVAWAGAVLAAVAVALLLHGALTLSERRGAFVSAVTHELRTPLTTFQMYTEMLADGMVTEEAKRRAYIETLRAEADRLSHLVENVLAYARLERGRPVGRVETVSLRDLLDRVAGRLTTRAERAGMTLCVETADGVAVRTDAAAIGQVLFNLVDNACKYAAAEPDRRIHIEADADGPMVAIRVRDHGPGIARREARRLFRPFRKSAGDAARSAPGVGLGLALSRQLARRLGGDLRLDETVTDGACFVLTLPCG